MYGWATFMAHFSLDSRAPRPIRMAPVTHTPPPNCAIHVTCARTLGTAAPCPPGRTHPAPRCTRPPSASGPAAPAEAPSRPAPWALAAAGRGPRRHGSANPGPGPGPAYRTSAGPAGEEPAAACGAPWAGGAGGGGSRRRSLVCSTLCLDFGGRVSSGAHRRWRCQTTALYRAQH